MKYSKASVLLLAPIVALVLAGPAEAEWFMTKGKARLRAERAAYLRYGSPDQSDGSYSSTCRPQSARYDPGYVYHRWVCAWADDYGCTGVLVIIGSRGRGSYYSTVVRGQRCPTG
jgi:hypothetical protein